MTTRNLAPRTFAEMSWSMRVAIILAALGGIAPGMLAARWYDRTYYQNTGYHPFSFGPGEFALEAEREAELTPSPIAKPPATQR